MATTPWPRWARFASVIVVLSAPAAFAHEHAGTGATLTTTTVVGLGLAPFAWFASGRTFVRSTMTLAALFAQILAHLVFVYSHGAGHQISVDMALAHTAAGAVSAIALAHADQLWEFVRSSLGSWRAFVAAAAPTVRIRTPRLRDYAAPFVSEPFHTTLLTRGPPASA